MGKRLLSELKRRRWSGAALKARLGSPSDVGHLHGVGYFGIDWVPQGLEVMGGSSESSTRNGYQLYDPFTWGPDELDLPPLETLERFDYDRVRPELQKRFAERLIAQRRIDDAPASDK